jgi:hypothetical protein
MINKVTPAKSQSQFYFSRLKIPKITILRGFPRTDLLLKQNVPIVIKDFYFFSWIFDTPYR